MGEQIESQIGDARRASERRHEQVESMAKRVDSHESQLEEFKVWQAGVGAKMTSRPSGGGMAPSADLQLQAVSAMDDLEATLARDRKQAQERLRSSCAELTSHLNDLRREMVEQRRISELTSAENQAKFEALQHDLGEQHSDL